MIIQVTFHSLKKLNLFNIIQPLLLQAVLVEPLGKIFIVNLDWRAVCTERFQNSLFPFCISQWNILDCHIRNLQTISSFKRSIFKFFRPSPASIFNVDEPWGIVLLTRLRVGFSHLREHKFRHNFMDTLGPLFSCRTNSIETTEHYLLQYPNHSAYSSTSFDSIHNMNLMLPPFDVSTLNKILLFADLVFNVDDNQGILRTVITLFFRHVVLVEH